MDRRNWLDEVARQLRSTGTSCGYQQRLLEELRDHLHEMHFEEGSHLMSADTFDQQPLEARLGSPSEIATAAETHAGRGRFARRHPVVTFLVLPLPVLLLLWVAYTIGLAGILQLVQDYQHAGWAVTLAGALIHGVAYVPAVALVLCLSWLASRSRARIAWMAAAAVLVAFVSSLMIVSFRMPTAPGTGLLQVGLGFPPHLAQWPQFAVPLAVAIASMLGVARRRRMEDLEAV